MNLDRLFAPYKPIETHLVDSLEYWGKERPEQVAYTFLVDGEEDELQITYTELRDSARAIAAQLQESGSVKGERVLLLYPPGMEFIKGFLGCLFAGAIAVPAYPPRRNRKMNRIDSIADDAKPKFVFATRDVIDRSEHILEDSPRLQSAEWIATEEVPVEKSTAWKNPDIQKDDLAFLQYTSGSTGTPKGVMISHGNMLANLQMITYAFDLSWKSRGLSWLPAYHDMGLIGGLLAPLYTGCFCVFMSPMAFLQKPIRWLKAISRYKITISGGPNFAYDLCSQQITEEQMESLNLSSWCLAYNGAEPIRSSTLGDFSRKFEEVGFNSQACYPCYGMAEATLIVTGKVVTEKPTLKSFDNDSLHEHRVVPVSPDTRGARTLVGCGSVFPNEDVAIVDSQTYKRLPSGEVGEIWVNSPSVGRGYWDKPALSQQTFEAKLADSQTGPYLRTGDLGFVQGDDLFVTGRLKDLIIIRGVNRYPQDIELTVERSSNRLQNGAVGCFAVDIDGRERLIVVAEVERKRREDWSDVIQAIRHDVTGEHDLPPDGIVLVRFGSIPKTSSGKIQRHACRNSFLDGSLKTIASWLAWEDAGGKEVVVAKVNSEIRGEAEGDLPSGLLELVMDKVRDVARERAGNLSGHTNIVTDLGLDSLERLQIANSIEEVFGQRFPEEVLQEIETVIQVASAVKEHFRDIGTQLGQVAKKVKSVRSARVAIPESDYNFALMPEYVRLQKTKKLLASTGLPNPYFSVHEAITNDTTTINGRELLSWSSYNYLGMSGDPAVVKASQEAVEEYGTSVSASRLVSGEKPIHRELEKGIADFIGVEDSITYVGGHSTNESTIGHLFGSGDLIVHDSLAHNSIIQGSILSGARRRPFKHNDWQELDEILAEVRHEYRRVLVVVEGVYSMDGDFPNLPKFIEIKKRHNVFLMVDEAHSIGTMGEHGRGISEHFGVDAREVDIWMGTLSKTFGSCGGYIAGTKELVEYLKYTSPGFVYSVGLSPANAAAALAALRLLEDEPERVAKVQHNSRFFLQEARKRGLDTGLGNNTPVVPVIIGNSLHALQLSHQLFERGINVQPILYPAVEEAAARLRFFISSTHTDEQIIQTCDAVAEEVQKIDPAYLKFESGTTRVANSIQRTEMLSD
ncbi:aminotransferase class I/II-fold pyridoxal phosphate-dependent enzyme [Pirellulaceae bacterium]|nr:aminotransferase class I/II-fold pyridoxal phosphate-dependent enzyme [Pirellulaceae bacterium]